MAIRPLQTVLTHNHNVAKNASFHAGQILARTSAGLVRAADRANSTSTDRAQDIVGISADDKARTGNTMILIDPVGSNYYNTSTGLIEENNNGYYVATKRALADYQDESVSNISDLTSGASGYQGPRRGVGVYQSQSGQFVTDMFKTYKTATGTTDAAFSGSDTFDPNDLLTYGAGDNAGYFVKIDDPADGAAIARVDSYDDAAGLLYITQL